MGYGQWFQQIGLGVLVYEMTGSGTQMGLIVGLRGGMLLVASPAGGILSDRMSRRTLIIFATAVGAAQAAMLAVIIISGLAEVWHLYVFALVEGIATGVNRPARQAFVRDITERKNLSNAVFLTAITMNASRVSGPPLAGAIYGLMGPAQLFFILAALKVVAMWTTILISRQTRQVMTPTQEAPLRGLWEGVHYVVQDRAILALVVLNTIPSLVIYPYVQLLPFFAYDVLNSGAHGYGWLASALGWGSIGGLVVLVFAGDVPRKGLVMFGTLLLYALLVVAFTQSEIFVISWGLLMVAGIFHGPALALMDTLFLLKSRENMTGRVMALNGMAHGLMPLGAIPMGISVDLWGAPNAVAAFVLTGALTIAVTAVLSTSLRRS